MRDPFQRTVTCPRLFHAPSSYYSMIARLALAEGGVSYEAVGIDIHLRAEQQLPDYVRLNPNMTVPTLVLPGRVLDQSRTIAEHALKLDAAGRDPAVTAWLDRHDAFPIEELTFGRLMARHPVARLVFPRLLGRARRRLLALAAAHPDLASLYEARAAVFASRIRTFDPGAAVRLASRREAEAIAMMAEIEARLSDGRATLEPTGYGVGDVVLTVFLARMTSIGLGDELQRRPPLMRYWQAMQARPSFAAADIWVRFDPIRLIRGVLR